MASLFENPKSDSVDQCCLWVYDEGFYKVKTHPAFEKKSVYFKQGVGSKLKITKLTKLKKKNRGAESIVKLSRRAAADLGAFNTARSVSQIMTETRRLESRQRKMATVRSGEDDRADPTLLSRGLRSR